MELTPEQELILNTVQAYASQHGWEAAPIMKIDGTMLGVIVGESGIVDYFAEED